MAKKKGMSLAEFNEKFGNELACEEYLLNLKKKEGLVCPKCCGVMFYYIGSRKIFQCAGCRHQVSLTSGTAMHKTHLPLQVWFLAIYLIATDKRGCSALFLSKTLKVTYKTAWFLLHRIRHAMGERDSRYLLCGVVELDDTYYGGTKKGGKRGRGTDKIKFLVAVSKDEEGKPEYAKMSVVKDLKGITVGRFAKTCIKEGSVVESDAYRSYRKPLADHYFHQYEVFGADREMLKWLHTIIGNVKAFIDGTYHGLGERYFQAYLDEFTYRLNRRNFYCGFFKNLLSAITYASPLPLAVLKE